MRSEACAHAKNEHSFVMFPFLYSTSFVGFLRRSSGVQWYFEVLHIQPIKINISLLPSARAQEGEMSRRYRIVSSLGINLLDVVNMPLKINAMILKNAFMQPRELARQVFRHILLQVSFCSRDHRVKSKIKVTVKPCKFHVCLDFLFFFMCVPRKHLTKSGQTDFSSCKTDPERCT